MKTPPLPISAEAHKWDQKYADQSFFYGLEPNDFLKHALQTYPIHGEVLSCGEGEGRNALYMAQSGLTVSALDQSAVGLHKASTLLAQHDLPLQTILADLSHYAFEDHRWDAIVLIWCHLPQALRAQVHQHILRSVKPGGYVILECYRPEQLTLGTGGPRSLDLLPTAEDLRREFSGLTMRELNVCERVVQEGQGHQGRSAVLQMVAYKSTEL